MDAAKGEWETLFRKSLPEVLKFPGFMSPA